jgi:hypothetical protein
MRWPVSGHLRRNWAALGAAHATGGSLVVLTGAAGRRREKPDYNI